MYKIESLETLQLENNQLEDILPGIDKLKNLEVLTIWGNKISPENILKIKKLLPRTSVVEKEIYR
ncbi:leucine-rich repeat domain-containing protein [Chryseobacterium sp. c4a]|uniref:leucine-rich repeat domain-containing protein n=1 Tax=Chryseobacterium sp. c4a TaxID=1573582 RepID=UPI0013596157